MKKPKIPEHERKRIKELSVLAARQFLIEAGISPDDQQVLETTASLIGAGAEAEYLYWKK